MASNSIRIGAALFDEAQRTGALMSRSAAQQLEHWARLGLAVEGSGLSVAQLAELLQAAPAADPWAFKRHRQAKDLEAVRTGRRSGAEMSWFAGGKAKATKLVDSPY